MDDYINIMPDPTQDLLMQQPKESLIEQNPTPPPPICLDENNNETETFCPQNSETLLNEFLTEEDPQIKIDEIVTEADFAVGNDSLKSPVKSLEEKCDSPHSDMQAAESKSADPLKSGPIDDYTRLSKKHQQLKKYKKEISPDVSIRPKENALQTESNFKNNVQKVSCDKPHQEKKKAKTLPEYATAIMKEWYEAHIDKPYPTQSERVSMAKRGDLNENQVKAWFANKRNRSNKQKNGESNKRKSSDKNSPCKEKLESKKKIKPQAVRKEQETSETQNSYFKILTLINEPIPTNDDANEYKVTDLVKESQVPKKSSAILPKQAKYKRQCKIQPQHIIQPLLQPRPAVIQPILAPYPDVHMLKKEAKPQIVPGQAFNQYYQVRPNNSNITDNNSLYSQNFPQYSTEKNLIPSLPKLQTTDESYFQSLQISAQQELGQPVQQNRNLHIQLHQFQKQNELQHQLHHHLQQKQKLDWEQQQQQRLFCLQKQQSQPTPPQQYPPKFISYQDWNSYLNPNSSPNVHIRELSPFQSLSSSTQVHPQPPPLNNTFSFNDNSQRFQANPPNPYNQKDNKNLSIYQNAYQTQQQQQHLFQQHKQCFDNTYCYLVPGSSSGYQPAPSNLSSNFYQQNQNTFQPIAPDVNNLNDMTIQNFPPAQISIVNNSVPIGSIPITSNINNQQQYQCDTPPPIITKKTSPNSQEADINSYQENKKLENTDGTKQKSSESPNKSTPEIENENNNLNQTEPKQQNVSNLQDPAKMSSPPNEQVDGISSKNLPQHLNVSSADLNTNFNDQIKVSYNGVNIYNNNHNSAINNGSGIVNMNNGKLGFSQINTIPNSGMNVSPKIVENNSTQGSSIYYSNLVSPKLETKSKTPNNQIDPHSNSKLTNLDNISNLSIVNIHPKVLENSSVNISINNNMPGGQQNLKESYRASELDSNSNNYNSLCFFSSNPHNWVYNPYYSGPDPTIGTCDYQKNNLFPPQNTNYKEFPSRNQFQNYLPDKNAENYESFDSNLSISDAKFPDQEDTRFTDSKAREWCMSNHPRLSNTLLNLKLQNQGQLSSIEK